MQQIKQEGIFSFRDFAESTISTYISYLAQFIEWVETELPGKSVYDITRPEIRSYIDHLRTIRRIRSRTINIHVLPNFQ